MRLVGMFSPCHAGIVDHTNRRRKAPIEHLAKAKLDHLYCGASSIQTWTVTVGRYSDGNGIKTGVVGCSVATFIIGQHSSSPGMPLDRRRVPDYFMTFSCAHKSETLHV